MSYHDEHADIRCGIRYQISDIRYQLTPRASKPEAAAPPAVGQGAPPRRASTSPALDVCAIGRSVCDNMTQPLAELYGGCMAVC
jgi:hypothetical protein